MDFETKVAGFQEAVFRRFLFFAGLATTLALLLTIGFFLHDGTHGLYMDDYSEKAWAFAFVTGKWMLNLHPQFDMRSLAHILSSNIANAIPQYEVSVRLGVVAVHICNVVLLGKLAYRLTGSALIGTLSGAYFIFPVFGNEALLWFTTAVSNTLSLLLLMIGFHCFLSCRSLRKDLVRMSCGIAAWILMAMIYESGLFTCFLLPFFFHMSGGGRSERKIWLTALATTLVPAAAYLALKRSSPNIATRGGATLNLAFILSHRVPEVSKRLWWLLTSFGVSGPLRDALKLGWREWSSVPGGPVVIAFAILGILLVVTVFPNDWYSIPAQSHLVGLASIGITWIVLCLVPIALLKSQIVEVRTLYIPTVGFSLSAAALSGILLGLFRRRRFAAVRVLLLVTGGAIFVSSLTMAGLVRVYQLRWYLDQKQLAAMQPVLSSYPSTERPWLIPVALDERIIVKSGEPNTTLNGYLFGVFETPWSTKDAIRLWFRDREVNAITSNHWDSLHFSSVGRSEGGKVSTVTVQGESVPVERLILFTYQHEQLVLLNPLELVSPGGVHSTIDLPLVAQAGRAGLKTQLFHVELDH